MDKTKTAGTSGRFFYSYQLTIYSKKLIIYSMNVKITRYDLNYLVTESVKRILNEDQTANPYLNQKGYSCNSLVGMLKSRIRF